MMKAPMLAICLMTVVLCGCSGLPRQYTSSSARSLVHGITADGTSIQIQSVDGNDVIRRTWFSTGHYGDKVWLTPGLHQLNLVCSTEDDKGGAYTINVEIGVGIQSEYTYDLTASPYKGEGMPEITVTRNEDERRTRFLP